MVVALFCLNIAMLAQAVSLKMNNVSVKEAMTQLKNKSGYSFVYKVGDLVPPSTTMPGIFDNKSSATLPCITLNAEAL